jgi:hypothetical protein
MLDLLERLADKSLLQAELTGLAARYRMLGIVREFAAEELARAAEQDAVRRAHLRWYVSFVQGIVPRIDRGEGGPQALERELDAVNAETPNLRVALDFARLDDDTIAALQIAGPPGHYAYLRGDNHEIRQGMDAAVTRRRRLLRERGRQGPRLRVQRQDAQVQPDHPARREEAHPEDAEPHRGGDQQPRHSGRVLHHEGRRY